MKRKTGNSYLKPRDSSYYSPRFLCDPVRIRDDGYFLIAQNNRFDDPFVTSVVWISKIIYQRYVSCYGAMSDIYKKMDILTEDSHSSGTYYDFCKTLNME